MRPCPSDDALASFAADRVALETRSAIEEHLDACPSCHCLFGELARGDGLAALPDDDAAAATWAPDRPASAETAMGPGAGFDGYVLQRRIDAGAMGEVWLAEDPSLKRPIAIKVLRGPATPRDPRWAGVLRREAQALAQLSHPNVVVVHDVAAWHGRDYLAMEYVAGTTLGEWLAAGAPTLAERLDALAQAGRGLAAAHRAGVIHRDFKPSNVLMGADGRARVSDFGLARPQRTAGSGADTAGAAPEHTSLAGTPAYMAPEQLRGEPPSAAGDQYSFAVALHEAVYGVRPYGGDSVRALLAAIDRGAPRPPPTRHRVPRWLRAIVLRGLHADPARRFPSMDALVAAIEAGRRRGRRRALAAALLAVAATTAAIAVPLSRRAAVAPPCGGEAATVAAVWHPARAAAIGRQLEHVGGAAGVEQWRRAAPLFAAYAGRWAAMRHETCQATRVAHVQSDSLFDRRMYCLDRRLAQLDGVATALATVESRKVALRALDIATGLPSLDACTASRWLADAPLPPLAQRTAIDGAYLRFDAARNLALQGRARPAFAALQALAADVAPLGFAPLDADLAYELADVADRLGELDVAAREYERASRLAAELGRSNVVFEAQLRAMRMEAYQGKYDLALARTSSLASLARLSTDPAHVAMHHENLGAIYDWQGRHADARAEYAAALRLLPDGAPTQRIAAAREGLGLVLMHQGDFAAAAPELARALELRETRYGHVHPLVANTLVNLGSLAFRRGRFAEALARWQRALAIQEALADPQGDPDVAITLGNVAIAEQALGQLERARATLERGLAMRVRFFGEEHPEVTRALANQGTLLAQLGRYAEGEAAARRALALRRKVLGPAHRDVAHSELLLGEVLVARGLASTGAAARAAYRAGYAELDAAVAHALAALGPAHDLVGRARYQRARARLGLGDLAGAATDAAGTVAIFAAAFGAGGDEMLVALTLLADVRARQGDAAQAVALLAPAVAARPLSAVLGGRAAFVLARACGQLGRRADARAYGARALVLLDGEADAEAAILARAARAWLAAQR